MSLIDFPSIPKIQSMTWRLVQPTQVNISGWTGGRQALASNRGWWEATANIPPIVGERNFLEWRRFLAQSRGMANTFKVPFVTENQSVYSGLTPRVNGAGQTGRTIATDGWRANSTVLRAGQAVNIGDQLVVLTADVTANGSGEASIEIEVPVRAATTDNTLITYQRPYCVMYLTEEPRYSVAPGMVFDLALDLREAF